MITDDEYPATRIEDLLATDLVDDPAATNSLFAVDSFSYQATRFLDENPAIAWLIAKKPDAIIEFMLKYFSNKKIKNQYYKNVPFIAVTSFAMKGDEQEFINAGCNDYISKLFTFIGSPMTSFT